MKKLAAIRKAYIDMFIQSGFLALAEEWWAKVEKSVTDNGWLDFRPFPEITNNPRDPLLRNLDTMDQYDPKYCYWKRPEALSGIEYNNGWNIITCEEDIQELADTVAEFVDACHLGNKTFEIVNGEQLMDLYKKGAVTHFIRPVPHKLPVY